MHLARIAFALPTVALLAACDQSPPPSAQTSTPAPAVAQPSATAPLFGTWAAKLANCGTAAIKISATRFEGAENQCDITKLADNGDGTFTASLACTGEGQAAAESVQLTPVFAPTGEGVTLTYLDRGGEHVTVLRCK